MVWVSNPCYRLCLQCDVGSTRVGSAQLSGLHSHQAVRLEGGTGTDPTGEYSHLLMLLAYACCYCWYGNQLGVCLGDGACMFCPLALRS